MQRVGAKFYKPPVEGFPADQRQISAPSIDEFLADETAFIGIGQSQISQEKIDLRQQNLHQAGKRLPDIHPVVKGELREGKALLPIAAIKEHELKWIVKFGCIHDDRIFCDLFDDGSLVFIKFYAGIKKLEYEKRKAAQTIGKVATVMIVRPVEDAVDPLL